MPQEVIQYLLDSNPNKRIQLQFAIQCAPLFKGIKEACIVMVPTSMKRELLNQLEDTTISIKLFYEDAHKVVLYLYRKDLLELFLAKDEVRRFLHEYEYSDLDTEDLLIRLASKAKTFYANGKEFPHEMGVFLGYPIGDVVGFINNRGKNSLMTGYWKVYENLEKAQELFLSYDLAKEDAVRELLGGKKLCEIAC